MEILQNLFRTLMFFIDNIVYGLIPQIYRLFIYLSEINLFSDNPDSPINKLVSHVYVLLGIFMLFKVSFSLLQYIVDPNAFRDSSKGMGKLITNVLVALILLVSVPSIFGLAMDIQSEIVQSNAIGQLILGTDTGSGNYPVSADGSISDEGVQQMAKDLQFMLYGAFYSVNQDVMMSGRVLEGCSGSSGVLGSIDMATTENCLNALQDNLPDDAASNGVSLYSFFKHVDENGNVVDEREFGHLDKLLWWKDDGDYVINYLPIISAAAGIYVILLLIGFCVDIAVRAIKLCFLQMLAPIAIVSYVDPKESISNGKLNAWIKECASTYFSLFLRLATIFLVMFLISMIASTLLSSGEYISGLPEDTSYNIWIYLFLVIGAFMFAKQVPNIIESIFGIKFSGELHLNPFKNAGMGVLGAVGATTGAAIGGAALGGIGNTAANLMRNRDLKQKLSEGKITSEQFDKQYMGRGALIGSAIGGFGSGAVRSAMVGAKTKRPISAISTGVKASSDSRRARGAGYGFVQNTKDKFVEMAGIESDMGTTDAVKSRIKELRNMMSNAQRDEAAASYQMQDLVTRDPNISSSMREAFSEEEKNGELKLKYDTYNDFLRSNVEQYGGSDAKQLFDEVDARMQNKIKNKEDISAELKEIDALVDNINIDGKKVLNRQDYDNYDNAKKARDKADELAKKYEKEISQLEETKGFVRHVGGGKK